MTGQPAEPPGGEPFWRRGRLGQDLRGRGGARRPPSSSALVVAALIILVSSVVTTGSIDWTLPFVAYSRPAPGLRRL